MTNDDTTQSTIARTVKDLRDEIGLTQTELAERAGMSLATIQDVERERWRHPKNPRTLRRLAKALDVDLRTLRGESSMFASRDIAAEIQRIEAEIQRLEAERDRLRQAQ